MIFRKSLSKKKGAAYSFFSGLSEGFIPGVVIALIGTVLMAVLPTVEFLDINSRAKENLANIGTTADKIFKFSVFGMRNTLEPFLIYAIFAVLGVFSMLVAVRIFRFICDKKTVNVYYSLGIKRTTLFISKYAAGSVILCCAVAVPVIFSYIINLSFLGASWQLSLVLLHFYCGLSVFLLLCFSITALVFSSVGTVSEAVVYSGGLLFAPTVLIFMIEKIVAAFLPSSVINEHIATFNQGDYYYGRSNELSFLESTANYNPVLFFTNQVNDFAIGTIDKETGKTVLDNIDSEWVFPNIFMAIPWFVIAITVAVLGAFLFKRIKAENCGFLNTNKILSNLTLFELCIFGSCLFLSELQWTDDVASIFIAGGVAAFAFYIIFEIFLKRNFKKIIKTLYKFVAHAAVIATIFGICSTGAFGYDTYIPARDKIKSAEVFVPFSYSEITTKATDYNWMTCDFVRLNEIWLQRYLPEMTSDKDIETVMAIHEKVNEIEKDDGLFCEIIINYNYKKNGSSSRKLQLRSREEIESLFTLCETDAYNEQLKKLFFEENRYENVLSDARKEGYASFGMVKKLAFEYEYGSVIARSPALWEKTKLELTKEQFSLVKDALYKDILAQSASDYFSGNAKQLGTLSFVANENLTNEIDKEIYPERQNAVYPGELVTMPSTPSEDVSEDKVPQEEQIPENGEFSQSNEIGEEIPEEKDGYRISDSSYNGLGNIESTNSQDFVITADMTNTLNLLKTLGYEKCFESRLEIESISFKKMDIRKMFENYSRVETTNYMLDFFGFSLTGREYIYYDDASEFDLVEECSENIIKDKEKIKELTSIAKLHEYTFDSGYFCLVKYDNDMFTTLYISEEDAPDYVRNYTYTKIAESMWY